MQARHHHHDDQRPPLRLNAVDWLIYAILVVCIVASWAFSCSSASDMR